MCSCCRCSRATASGPERRSRRSFGRSGVRVVLGPERDDLTAFGSFETFGSFSQAYVPGRGTERRPFYSWRSASIGSSRAARTAGTMPKKIPTVAEKPNPEGERPPGQRYGKTCREADGHPDCASEDDAEHAAERRQSDGFGEELKENLLPPRAERLAQADLAGALRDRDRHDRHDPDPAHHQRDR